MARTAEFLMPPPSHRYAGPMIEPLRLAAERAGCRTVCTSRYEGMSDWLVLYGVGAAPRTRARAEHIAKGRAALLWDLAYFGRDPGEYIRVSVNHDHPQDLLDRAPQDPGRWDALGIELREDGDASGPIILVGLGYKSRIYLGAAGANWEERKLFELRCRFPRREIIHRPKRADRAPSLDCRTDDSGGPIEDLLRGASLVVCRHSNVAVDAAIAGVPFECEDGAAKWLDRREFTPVNRLEFLRRLAWFQWRPDEVDQAWAFASTLLEGM